MNIYNVLKKDNWEKWLSECRINTHLYTTLIDNYSEKIKCWVGQHSINEVKTYRSYPLLIGFRSTSHVFSTINSAS